MGKLAPSGEVTSGSLPPGMKRPSLPIREIDVVSIQPYEESALDHAGQKNWCDCKFSRNYLAYLRRCDVFEIRRAHVLYDWPPDHGHA
jgi:hypothetical protein